MDLFTNNMFFGIFISLIAFEIGLFIYRKTKFPLFNPLLIATIIVIAFLKIFNIDFDTYNKGGQFINVFLGPATIVLAVPLYKNLHLLKKNFLPIFTGIFIGGFAVLIIGHLGLNNKYAAKDILKATTTVICIKFLVNPATSPMAYIAVGFQGLLGALVYSHINLGRFLTLPYAIIAMMESAVQKLLIIWLIFGDGLISGINAFIDKVFQIFGTNSNQPFAEWIIVFYLSVYLICGIVIGAMILKMPNWISRYKPYFLALDLKPAKANTLKKHNKPLLIILSITLIIFSFLINSADPLLNGFILFSRVLIIALCWYVLIAPIIKILVNKRTDKAKSSGFFKAVHKESEKQFLYVIPLLETLRKEYKGYKLFKMFVIGLLVLSKNE